MEAVAGSNAGPRPRSLALLGRLDPGAAVAWAIPFVLVLYLALSNGGYDVVERSEVGVALWWLLLVGALLGTFTMGRGSALAPLAAGLLLAFAAWTALALSWSGSDERTMIELSRVATFIGAFLLAITAQASGRWRAVLGGLTAAVGLVVALAVLSRMHPDLFPVQTAGQAFPGAGLESRLAYPLNYSSGLAALAVMALPLLLRAGSEASSIAVQGLAAGLVPIAVFALWLTGSSLTIPLLAVGVTSYLALSPDRLPKLLTLFSGAAGATVLIAASEQRDAFDSGVPTPAAMTQGDEVFVIAILVVAAVAALQVAIGLAVRHGNRPRPLVISRPAATKATAAVLLVALVGFLLSPAPGALSDGWADFTGKSQVEAGDTSRSAQILDVSSRGRSAFWESAVDASGSEPLRGIGPGTFEFWWAQNGNTGEFVRDAHSLYLETLAELGIPGAALIGGFMLLVVVGGSVRTFRVPEEQRGAIAAVTAATAVFAVAAGLDWMWELGAVAILCAALAGLALGAREDDRSDLGRHGPIPRVAIAALAIAALAIVAIPLGGATAIDRSQDAANAGMVPDAIGAAGDAEALEPYAATPVLQLALLLESEGRFAEAATAARDATESERENWRLWLTLSRLEAKAGNARAAVDAYREARRLNPNSTIFAQ